MNTNKILLRPRYVRGLFAAVLCGLAWVAAADRCVAAGKNLPPIAQNLSVVAAANLSTPIALQGSDPNGDSLAFSIVTPPAHGTLSGTAPNVVYSPSLDFLGADSFAYRVSDGKAASSPATVSITVKRGIVINDVSLAEGNSGTSPFNFIASMTAPGNALDPVTVSYRTVDETAVGSGLLALTPDYLSASGTLTFGAQPVGGNPSQILPIAVVGDTTLEPDETFVIQLFNASDNAVIVKGTGRGAILNDDRLNRPPTALSLSVVAVANRSTPLVLQGSDPDGDPLSFSIVTPPVRGTLSGTAPNLTYTPSGGNFVGSDQFSYVVSDGQAASSPATVNIAVKVGLSIDNVSVVEGTGVQTEAIFTVSLTAKPESQGVRFSYRTIDETAAGADLATSDADYQTTTKFDQTAGQQVFIKVSVFGDARIEPDETFLVELFDPSDNAVILNGTGRCTILNDDPTPVAQTLSVVAAGNRSTPIVLQGSDPQGRPVTFAIVSGSGPAHGTLTGTAPNLIYTPVQDYLGPDRFQYVVSNGTFTSAPATVNLTVKHGLEINNISIIEGNSGTRTAVFTVSLTVPASELDLVVFEFQTADGTARAGGDYVATGGTASVLTATQLSVPVIGDTLVEFNESFLMQLTDVTSNGVIVNGIGRCTIVDDEGLIRVQIGTAALQPEDLVAEVSEPVHLSLTWTHPVGWRKLNSIDVLLVDDQGEALAMRWHEAENSFSLFNPAADRFVQTAAAGSRDRFETSAVTFDVEQSTGGGPPGQTVTIDLSLSFKPHAAGRTFSVEAFATDDEGSEQGFESVGTITVLPR